MVGKRPHTSFHMHPRTTTFSSRFLFWKNESEAFPPWGGFWAPTSMQKRGASIPTRREGAGLRLQYRASEETAGLSQQQTARHCVSERFLSESTKGPVSPPLLAFTQQWLTECTYVLGKHQDTVRPRNVVAMQ